MARKDDPKEFWKILRAAVGETCEDQTYSTPRSLQETAVLSIVSL